MPTCGREGSARNSPGCLALGQCQTMTHKVCYTIFQCQEEKAKAFITLLFSEQALSSNIVPFLKTLILKYATLWTMIYCKQRLSKISNSISDIQNITQINKDQLSIPALKRTGIVWRFYWDQMTSQLPSLTPLLNLCHCYYDYLL